jgi:L-malate glycosyltransferase
MTVKRCLMHVFPGFDIGGVQLRITSVMNRYPDRYRHLIVATNGRYDCLSRIEDNVDATAVSLSHSNGRPDGSLRGINRQIAAAAPDLLVTYNWGAIEWAMVNRVLRHVPHLHMESGFGPDEADRQLRRRVVTRRIALARTARLVVPSLNLERIARENWRLPAEKILYVPNGVDVERFSEPPDQSILPDWTEGPGTIVIGTVAPMRPEKNLFRLLRGFAAIVAARPARLLLVGDGPDRAALEQLAAELGIAAHVHFTGYLDSPEKVFGLMDIYAISSDTEQMPNALIQAMAAARPVVGMAVGDVAHIVAEPNRSFIAPAGDDAAFDEALQRMCDDATGRLAIGEANLQRVRETFEQERMFDIYRGLFDGELAG